MCFRQTPIHNNMLYENAPGSVWMRMCMALLQLAPLQSAIKVCWFGAKARLAYSSVKARQSVAELEGVAHKLPLAVCKTI